MESSLEKAAVAAAKGNGIGDHRRTRGRRAVDAVRGVVAYLQFLCYAALEAPDWLAGREFWPWRRREKDQRRPSLLRRVLHRLRRLLGV